VVVSHADPIKAAIAHYTGVHLDLFQRIMVSPASVNAFAFSAHGVALLKCNDTGSLEDLARPRRRRPPQARNRRDGRPIELDPVDTLGAGAVGEPGQREFYLQARKERAQLTVLVEKEQIALLATEAVAFLDRIADEYPEEGIRLPISVAELQEPTVPLFRARLIGLGFDPERELVLIELRERSADGDEEDVDDEDPPAPRWRTRRTGSWRGCTRPAPRCGPWRRGARRR